MIQRSNLRGQQDGQGKGDTMTRPLHCMARQGHCVRPGVPSALHFCTAPVHCTSAENAVSSHLCGADIVLGGDGCDGRVFEHRLAARSAQGRVRLDGDVVRAAEGDGLLVMGEDVVLDLVRWVGGVLVGGGGIGVG